MNLEFDVSDKEIEKLDEMLKSTNSDSYKSLFNDSLSLFNWAVQHIKAGRVIAAVDEGGQKYIEVHMPSLQYVADNKDNSLEQATGTNG
jgi:hypothetical protein